MPTVPRPEGAVLHSPRRKPWETCPPRSSAPKGPAQRTAGPFGAESPGSDRTQGFRLGLGTLAPSGQIQTNDGRVRVQFGLWLKSIRGTLAHRVFTSGLTLPLHHGMTSYWIPAQRTRWHRMARQWIFCKCLVVFGLVLGAFTLSAASARAFYWYEWPGSSVPTTSPTSPKVTTKSTDPGGDGDPGGGPNVPEPTSILTLGIGMGIVGVVRAMKGKNKKRRDRLASSRGESGDEEGLR